MGICPFQTEICLPHPSGEVSGLYDMHMIILALSILSISISVRHSRPPPQSTEGNGYMNAIHLIETSPLGREESWARIADFSLLALKEDCRINSGTMYMTVRKTNSSSVATGVWARIMLAACLRSAIHIHKALTKEKIIGSGTVLDRSPFLQLDGVLLSPEQKAGSKLLTSVKWHHLAMGLAGISKRPHTSHLWKECFTLDTRTLQLSTCRPCSGGNHHDAGPRARCGISCYGANPAQKVSKTHR